MTLAQLFYRDLKVHKKGPSLVMSLSSTLSDYYSMLIRDTD